VFSLVILAQLLKDLLEDLVLEVGGHAFARQLPFDRL
jgi:hypothetical protein